MVICNRFIVISSIHCVREIAEKDLILIGDLKTMSSLNSIFKTPNSIAEEFNRQHSAQNKI